MILTAVGGGGAAGVVGGVGIGVALARAADVGEADVGGVEEVIACAFVDPEAEPETDGVAAPPHPTSITPSSTTATVVRNRVPPSSAGTVAASGLETRLAGHCLWPRTAYLSPVARSCPGRLRQADPRRGKRITSRGP